MKKERIVMRFMGVDIVLRVDFPKSIKNKENRALDLAEKELKIIIDKEFRIQTEEEIRAEVLSATP